VTSGSGLGLIGLGLRAGTVTVGTGIVRAGLQRDDVVLVVVAGDASERTRSKVIGPAQARGIPVVAAPSAEALGRAVGREQVQAVGIRDRHLARGLRAGLPAVGSQEE